MKVVNVFLALSLVVAAVPAAAQDAWQLDKSHSSLEFAVTHMVVAEATGRFKDFDVKLTAPGNDYTKAAVEVTIQMASVNTDNEYRDNDLRGPEFFDAAKWPTAVFKSTKWEKLGDTKWKITGDLTIRDITKPVVLDATLLGTLDSPRGARAGWKAETTIDRFEFGTTWNKTLDAGGVVVSKDVRLTIRLEMKKPAPEQKDAPPPPPKN